MLTVGCAAEQHRFIPFPWLCCRWPRVVTLSTVALLAVVWPYASFLAVLICPDCAVEASEALHS